MAETLEKSSDAPLRTAELVPVRVIDIRGQSALVEYEQDGIPYRSHVDAADVVGDQCPAERLADAPHGIAWDFDFADLGREIEIALKRARIWTYEDLQQRDRVIIRIATNLVGRAIWDAAKRGCNRR